MKRAITLILCFILGCFGFVACKDETPTPTPTPTVTTAEYTITYYAIIDGTKTSIPSAMHITNGSYPTTYKEGDTVTFDMLQDHSDGTTTYDFVGWYTDMTCTEKVEGTLSAGIKGNIVLYAKIVKSVVLPTEDPTITYFAVIEEGGVKTTSSIPDHMYKTNGKYPVEYIEGEGTKIDDLSTWDDTTNKWKYTFEGWYTDSSVDDKYKINEIPSTATGGIVLYAKIKKTVIQDPDEGSWTKNY